MRSDRLSLAIGFLRSRRALWLGLVLAVLLPVWARAADTSAWFTVSDVDREAAYLRAHPGLADAEPDLGHFKALRFPAVQILAPSSTGGAVVSPVRVELSFSTTPGAKVLPSSFRILYGFLRLDITEKVLRHAQLTEKGLIAERAEIPSGNHRLFLVLEDDHQNHSETELRFEVQ